jgi:hypothetical protein
MSRFSICDSAVIWDRANGLKKPGSSQLLDENRLAPELLSYPMEQVISWPQHRGDLILPCPFGHLEICTFAPLSSVRVSFSRGASHLAQVAFTLIPHLLHS